jgi:hypothetical protein
VTTDPIDLDDFTGWVPFAELHELWVPGTRTVYIGKANHGSRGKRGLYKRLDEFRRFGAGEPVGHSGGRRIWQLADHADLLVGWRVTEVAQIETDMITRFRAHHGHRPFANIRN